MKVKCSSYLSLLGGLDNNSVSGVVELPGNDAQEFGLVLVAIVIGGADTYELEIDKLSQVCTIANR